MFNNIGGKIKTVAATLCVLGIAISVVSGIILMAQGEDSVPIGLLVVVAGPIFSWLGSFMTYGLGQLIENSDILVNLYADERIIMLRDWKERGLITNEEFLRMMQKGVF